MASKKNSSSKRVVSARKRTVKTKKSKKTSVPRKKPVSENILELKSGKKIEIKDFQPTESNLIKVDLHWDNEQHEGIWACLPDEFMEDYKKDASDSEVFRYATLRNAALNLGPASWGAIIPVKFRGSQRPECNLAWISENAKMIFNEKETIKS